MIRELTTALSLLAFVLMLALWAALSAAPLTH
jgi:hypothetical protein